MNEEKIIKQTQKLIADSAGQMNHLVERLVASGALKEIDPVDLAASPKAMLFTALRHQEKVWKPMSRKACLLSDRWLREMMNY